MSSSQTVAYEIYKNISDDEETKGFDLCAGANWIYPLNYPIRDYQFNIVKNALFENTLVSLPTGLGKTFIAAVIMYNYFRWYPNGKIIFMAPTKPLVRQQIDACYTIVGIPKEITVELTGTIQQTTRATLWRDKRVFFITPHVLQNDLDIMPAIADNIKCLVLDEAHKAKGTYAYCEVMRKLQDRNKYFRVLALSATPGGTVREILEVAKTLYISHLEVRTDETIDVAPYVYKRGLTTVKVPFDKKLYDVREEYLKIIEQYARVLIQNKVFTGNYSQLTKGRIFMTLKDYQARKAKNVNIPNYNNIMKSLNICLTLYHGLELLTRHGLRGFLLYYEEHIQKPLLRGNQALHDIINDLNEYLGPLPDWHPLPDGSIPKFAKNIRFGHPKFRKLGDVLSAHFIESDDDATRVIVFFEYKDSVLEAHALLLEYHPLIRARVFMGQSSITQKQQKSTLNIFRTGECNTLLSTSIGEEGLDVGEVDLIVCFDISSKSPIRMVQRMGRTGRKREGRIVVLITEGKEEELLRECLVQKKMLNESILNCSELHTHLYQDNPKMVPNNIEPQCQKMHITIRKEEEKPAPTKIAKTSTKISKNNVQSNAIKVMFESISCCEERTNVTYPETVNRLPEPVLLCLVETKEPVEDSTKLENSHLIDFSKYLEKQRSWQDTFLIDHSEKSELLRSVLQFSDSKRFNIPQTQIERTKSTKTGAGLYQPDIRSMFLKQKQTPMSQLEVDANLSEKVAEILFENKQHECSNNLQAEIRDYLTISYVNMFNCQMCDKYKNICNLFKYTVKEDHHFNALSWTQPDNSIFEYLNKDTLSKFLKQSKGDADDSEDIVLDEDEFISTGLFADIKCQNKETNEKNIDNNNCTRDSIRRTNTPTDKNNMLDSFKDDDFFSTNLIEDLLTEKNNMSFSSSENKIQLDKPICGSSLFCNDQRNNNFNKSVAMKLELTSPENTTLIDEFISTDILAQFNLNSSSQAKYDETPDKKLKCNCPLQRTGYLPQEVCKSPKSSFNFKKESAINKPTVSYNDNFFSDDLLNQLSGTHCSFKDSKLQTVGTVTSKNKSFKRISDIDKSVVLSVKKCSNNEKPKENLETDGKNNNSSDDEFMDMNAILAQLVKGPRTHSPGNDTDSNDTILNSIASDNEELNCLNDAFYDQKSASPKGEPTSKFTENSHNSPTISVARNDCISPELFCDSDDVYTPEAGKDLQDNSQDRTILCTPKSSRESSNSSTKSKHSPLNCKSPYKLLKSDNESQEKSPSLWNLTKIYTQSSRDFNASCAKETSLSIESLNFNERVFNYPGVSNKDVNTAPKRAEQMHRVKRKLSLNSSFLDMEAELDGSQSADEDEADLNEYDASFVNDASQDVGNSTTLHAFYLKTSRSPKLRENGFKIPALPKIDKMNIFSQIEPTQNDTYLEDSFCVDVLTQNITTETELDVLEEAEKILKNKKRRKKSSHSQDRNQKKRRRILVLSDSD